MYVVGWIWCIRAGGTTGMKDVAVVFLFFKELTSSSVGRTRYSVRGQTMSMQRGEPSELRDTGAKKFRPLV